MLPDRAVQDERKIKRPICRLCNISMTERERLAQSCQGEYFLLHVENMNPVVLVLAKYL